MQPALRQILLFGAQPDEDAGIPASEILAEEHESLYDLGVALLEATATDDVVEASSLTINGQSCGAVECMVKDGPQTISSFSAGDWFGTNADSHSAIVVVKGNLTIDAGQIVIPGQRKLFTFVFVEGDLAIAGGISMTARGANHSTATGSSVTAVALRIIDGEHGGVTDPQVPAAGAAGGASGTGDANGNAGTAGTAGGTGGGGSGGRRTGNATTGAGAAGTCFSGGPASGACRTVDPLASEDAGIDGGAGGAANSVSNLTCSGGAGNPGGAGRGSGASGGSGTGGTLIIICLGALSGAGTVTANGANGGNTAGANEPTGGGSGGGSITILYGTDTSTITPAATGGAGGTGSSRVGGAGGDGTARKLELAA